MFKHKSTKITLLIPLIFVLSAAACDFGTSLCEDDCERAYDSTKEWCEKDCPGNLDCEDNCKGEAEDDFVDCIKKCRK